MLVVDTHMQTMLMSIAVQSAVVEHVPSSPRLSPSLGGVCNLWVWGKGRIMARDGLAAREGVELYFLCVRSLYLMGLNGA